MRQIQSRLASVVLVVIGLACMSMAVRAYTMLHVGAQGLAKGVPDFCEEPGSVVVANFVTTTWGPGTLTAPCYGVHGTVTVADGTRFETKNIIIYEDGSLTIGTPGDPAENVVVEFQNVALDTDEGDDPEQFGNSLMCFGTCKIHGTPKTSFIRLAAEVSAGATTLTCGGANNPYDPAPPSENCPADWKAGDVLVLPDTRQLPEGSLPTFPNNSVRATSQSETVTIKSISGSTITLTGMTTYEHVGAHHPTTDAILIFPHVGNLTRSVVFTSKDTATTLRRGMTLASQRAVVDWRYIEFNGLGRTTADFPDSTTFSGSTVTHVGTNQIGRYPVHMHHLYGPVSPQANGYQFTLKGLAIRDFRKWGMAIHNSHWGLIEDNIVFDGEGSAYVTEDGAETENVFNRNFAVKIGRQLTDEDAEESQFNPHGRKGSCFWFRSPTQIVTENVCADTREGFDWETSSAEAGPHWGGNPLEIPDYQGADTSTTANTSRTLFIDRPNLETRANEAYSTSEFAMGFWSSSLSQMMPGGVAPATADSVAGRFAHAVEDSLWWHNLTVIRFQYGDVVFDGGMAINEHGIGDFMHFFNDSAPLGNGKAATEFNNLTVRGLRTAYISTGQLGQSDLKVTGGLWQTLSGFLFNNRGQALAAGYTGMYFTQHSSIAFDGVSFEALPGKDLAAINLEFDTGLDGGYPTNFNPHRHLTITVTNYQGETGHDFRVWWAKQAPAEPSPEPGPPFGIGGVTFSGCPESGLTNAQQWALNGCATLMEVAPSGTTTRAEIVGGILSEGVGGGSSGMTNQYPMLVNPGSRSTITGQPVSLQLTGSDPEGSSLTYSVTGLPAGLALSQASGLISGVPTSPGTYLVTARVSDGVLVSPRQAFTWVISNVGQIVPPIVQGGGGDGTTTDRAVVRRASSASTYSGTVATLRPDGTSDATRTSVRAPNMVSQSSGSAASAAANYTGSVVTRSVALDQPNDPATRTYTGRTAVPRPVGEGTTGVASTGSTTRSMVGQASNQEPAADASEPAVSVDSPTGTNLTTAAVRRTAVSAPASAPSVSIETPVNQATFAAGSSVIFYAIARDVEDGDLTAQIVWTSSVDGRIGTGALFNRVLSSGSHTITASVTDSKGNARSAQVTVVVQ